MFKGRLVIAAGADQRDCIQTKVAVAQRTTQGIELISPLRPSILQLTLLDAGNRLKRVEGLVSQRVTRLRIHGSGHYGHRYQTNEQVGYCQLETQGHGAPLRIDEFHGTASKNRAT